MVTDKTHNCQNSCKSASRKDENINKIRRYSFSCNTQAHDSEYYFHFFSSMSKQEYRYLPTYCQTYLNLLAKSCSSALSTHTHRQTYRNLPAKSYSSAPAHNTDKHTWIFLPSLVALRSAHTHRQGNLYYYILKNILLKLSNMKLLLFKKN